MIFFTLRIIIGTWRFLLFHEHLRGFDRAKVQENLGIALGISFMYQQAGMIPLGIPACTTTHWKSVCGLFCQWKTHKYGPQSKLPQLFLHWGSTQWASYIKCDEYFLGGSRLLFVNGSVITKTLSWFIDPSPYRSGQAQIDIKWLTSHQGPLYAEPLHVHGLSPLTRLCPV